VDHRGVDLVSVFYPLPHLRQARAFAQSGDSATARRAYDAFLSAWTDADADVPVLVDARREYARLR